MSLSVILLIVAIVIFIVAAFAGILGLNSRVSLTDLGLAFLGASFLPLD